ncbi:DUF6233 domain-containing protein [Streptomyces sp. NPDC015346]|uniref:DUF6233 domain-containing protein n=1 Tax=Streptomyces sp. NPDC015346 TaxID=3364954 RepID=UPI0036F6762E
MTGMPISERIEKQRAVLAWLEYQVAQTRKTIRALKAEEKEQERRRAVARAEMSWKVMPSRAVEGQPMLHRGNCHIDPRQTGFLSSQEVITALREFPAMEMCEICNVISSLGQFGIEKPPPRKLPGGGTP